LAFKYICFRSMVQTENKELQTNDKNYYSEWSLSEDFNRREL